MSDEPARVDPEQSRKWRLTRQLIWLAVAQGNLLLGLATVLLWRALLPADVWMSAAWLGMGYVGTVCLGAGAAYGALNVTQDWVLGRHNGGAP